MRTEAAVVMMGNTTIETTQTTGSLTTRSGGPLILIKFISLGLIIAVGSAGNALVIYAFGRHLKVRRSPYQLMMGFVSLDLIRVFFFYPVTFMTVVHRLQWKYGPELCQLMAFTNVFCLLGNSLSIFGMSVDRYIDNTHRVFYRRRFRGFLGTAMLLAVWGIALLFAFPTVYTTGSQRYFLLKEARCTSVVGAVGLAVGLTVTILMTNAVYIRLFLFLRRRRRMRPVVYEPAISENWGFFETGVPYSVRRRWVATSETSAPIAVIGRSAFQNHHHHHHHQRPTSYDLAMWRNGRQRDNEKLTKLCFTINIIFTLMWSPYIVISFCFAMEFRGVPAWLEATATWLTYLQVAVTPLAFFSLSTFTRNSLLPKRRCSPTLSNSSNE